MDKVRNVVLERLTKYGEIIRLTNTRKLSYFAHIVRQPEKYDILQIIMQGKIYGKWSRGRRITSWIENIRQCFGKTAESFVRAAVN